MDAVIELLQLLLYSLSILTPCHSVYPCRCLLLQRLITALE
jgi:hypothetical protein